MSDTATINTGTTTYLHPPRLERIPAPRYTAKDILGVSGQPGSYRGGLKAYLGDRRAHRAYRAWREQYGKRRLA
jgi:hypothetical protein